MKKLLFFIFLIVYSTSLSFAQGGDKTWGCDTYIEIGALPYLNVATIETEIGYFYRPRVDQLFRISTCTPTSSDSTKFVDTEMWIYSFCDTLMNLGDGPEGAITYVDDGSCGIGANIGAIELKQGEIYFFRIRNKSGETPVPINFELDFSNEIMGCTDVKACNFDPYASIEDNSCYYNNCVPDLIIDEEKLISTMKLDTIINLDPCLLEEGCLSGTGKRDILRFATLLKNIGTADYIIGTEDDNPNALSRNNCHNHLHAQGYAEYLLFRENGDPYPIGFKNGYCVLDLFCDDDKNKKFTCDYMGISVGCSDNYSEDTECQWIDLTDIPDGRYTFVVRINWNRLPDLRGFEESNYDNNWAQVCIDLNRSSDELAVEIVEGCPAYTDCLGIEYGSTLRDCNNDCGGSAYFGDINDDQILDSLDFDLLFLDILDDDIIISPCDDLFQDNRRSMYDLTLLWQCLDSNLDTSTDHNHCEFPNGKLNELDTIGFELGDLRYHSFDILANSNSDIAISALEIGFEGIHIDSVIVYDDNNGIDLKYNDTKMYLFAKNNCIQTSDTLRQLFKVYYSQDVRQMFCLQPNIESINQDFEKIISLPQNTICLDPTTVSIIDGIPNNKVRVYPNVLSGEEVSIELEDQTISRWEIFNTSGRLMKKARFSPFDTVHKISVNDLPQGIYFITIIGKDWSSSHRIVKL